MTTTCKPCGSTFGGQAQHCCAPPRFWEKVIQAPSGHWMWVGAKNSNGYGRIYAGPDAEPRVEYAHRFSYRMFVGPTASGMVIDHLCRVTLCVNPLHLQQVTNRENVVRGYARTAKISLTHCPNGHAYAGDNLFHQKGTGARLCRECNRAHNRAYYWKQKEMSA